MNKWQAKTRGGADYKIYQELPEQDEIHGTVYWANQWIPCQWDMQGRMSSYHVNDHDLVANTHPRFEAEVSFHAHNVNGFELVCIASQAPYMAQVKELIGKSGKMVFLVDQEC